MQRLLTPGSVVPAITLAVTFVSSAVAQGPAYTVTDLGDLGGGAASSQAINHLGHVAGSSENAGDQLEGYVFVNGVMIPTGVLDPDGTSIMFDSNADRQAAGWSQPPGFQLASAVLWNNGELIELPTHGGLSAGAFGINELGIVVGRASRADGNEVLTVWIDGDAIDLGSLPGVVSGYASGTDINELGEISGQARTELFRLHAIRWDETNGMIDLGNLASNPEAESASEAINNRGVIVGWAFNDANQKRAFIWTEADGMIELPPLPGNEFAEAFGLNDLGVAVGTSYGSFDTRAVMWRDGEVIDLEQEIDPGLRLQLFRATGINNAGQISATAFDGANLRAVRLDPVGFRMRSPDPGRPGERNGLIALGAGEGDRIAFAYSLRPGSTSVPGCPGVSIDLANAQLVGTASADADGVAVVNPFVPAAASGRLVLLQAVNVTTCEISNLTPHYFP